MNENFYVNLNGTVQGKTIADLSWNSTFPTALLLFSSIKQNFYSVNRNVIQVKWMLCD